MSGPVNLRSETQKEGRRRRGKFPRSPVERSTFGFSPLVFFRHSPSSETFLLID
ncbi:hypothetical protein NORO109296_24855 [Nocardiopsis rhodophaea]